jgi:menaquinone reductase, molybdopterin-binding-like subunit
MSRRPPDDTPPAKPDRRQVLGGAALASAALLGCGMKPDPYRIEKPALRTNRGWHPGEERWVLSTCTLCEAGCGIKVRVVEGRAVKIEGNSEHPVNRGGLCSRGQAGLQLLYHPDRVRSPLRRGGARGEGKWQPISWVEAMGEVVSKLERLRTDGHPERLVLVDGQSGGFTHDLWGRFLKAFGSDNHVTCESPTLAGVDLAAQYMWGGLPAYDLERSRFVLAMGAEWLESSGQALRFWRAASAPADNGRRLRVVCVSARRPFCRVDEWIPILPGATGAFALSLAHVLMRDRLIDKDFVRDHVIDHLSGQVIGDMSEGDQQRLRRSALEWVQAEYGPERTAKSTGISADTVQRLAHELAENRPAVVASDGSAAAASNGLATAMAIFSLNALLGNLEQPGGVFLQRKAKLTDWASGEHDQASHDGLMKPRIDGVGTVECPLGPSRVQSLPSAIAQGRPYPVEALFLHRADPLSILPGRQAWTEALRKVPWVVSFSSLLDPSTLFADLVLPAHLPLEDWDVVTPAPADGEPLLGLCQPVVTPVHDTRPVGDVILALAAGLGGSIGRSLPWKSYVEATTARLQGLLKASADGDGAEDMKTLLAEMNEKGGRWPEPGEARSPLAGNDTGKLFYFTSPTVLWRLRRGEGTKRVSSDWPCEGLPPWEPARFAGAPSEFSFQLLPYRPRSFSQLGLGFLPWLDELPMVSGDPWPARAEIHPDDAGQLGLADGDRVMVESPVGACEALAQITGGVRPGVVAMALGKGGLLDLIVPDEDRLSGLIAWQGTHVRVRKLA